MSDEEAGQAIAFPALRSSSMNQEAVTPLVSP